MNVNTKHAEPVGAVVLRFAERMSLGALPGSFAACAADDARAMQAELAASRAQVAILREALGRIANSEPRPNRNRCFAPDVVQSLRRTARAALAVTKAHEGGAR